MSRQTSDRRLIVGICAISLLMVGCGGGGGGGEDADLELASSSFISIETGSGFDYTDDVAIHSDGSMSTCGSFENTHTFAPGRSGETTRMGAGTGTGFCCRYEADGRLRWVCTVESDDFARLSAVVSLPDGACMVMGTASGRTEVAPLQPNAFVFDETESTFAAKFSATGELLWVRVIRGYRAGINSACALADGSAAFCGYIDPEATFGEGEASETTLSSVATAVVTNFVARYASDGSLIYATTPGIGSGFGVAMGIAALPGNELIVTGTFTEETTFASGTPREQVFVPDGIDDGYIARLDANGAVRWARHATGTNREFLREATVLANGAVAVFGTFNAGAMTLNVGQPDAMTLTSQSDANSFIACFDVDGGVRWAKYLEHRVDTFLNSLGIAALGDGSFIVLGEGPGVVTINPDSHDELHLAAFERNDYLIAKFDASGALIWARRDGGIGSTSPWGDIAAFDDGSFVIGGTFYESFTVNLGTPNEQIFDSEFQRDDLLLIRYDADGIARD